jgi:hypothetical protein
VGLPIQLPNRSEFWETAVNLFSVSLFCVAELASLRPRGGL